MFLRFSSQTDNFESLTNNEDKKYSTEKLYCPQSYSIKTIVIKMGEILIFLTFLPIHTQQDNTYYLNNKGSKIVSLTSTPN
jgi:hypothetical protein